MAEHNTGNGFEDIVLGEDCSQNEIAAAIKECQSFSRLYDHWQSVARHLRIPEQRIEGLSKDFLLKREVSTLEQLTDKLLSLWKSERGKDAKITDLCNAFRTYGLTHVAEAVELKVAELIGVSQLAAVQFLFQGKLWTWGELTNGVNISDSLLEIYEELKKSYRKPIRLLDEELIQPQTPTYYIPRTLSHSTELNPAIFLSNSSKNNVFLFNGMSKRDLARLTEHKEPIEESHRQLQDVTVRFITLEYDKDFETICAKTDKPVHLIQFKEGCHTWVKSNKNLDLIRQYLKRGREMDENWMVKEITSQSPPCGFVISDTPGMGKTLFLANLANKIQDINPTNTILLFIDLPKFCQHLHCINSGWSALEALAAYSSSDHVSKLVLMKMLQADFYQLNLFIDGYDEILQKEQGNVDAFLINLKELKHAKTIVSTRPHLRNRLESIFNCVSYEIQPFNLSNQVQFLTSYWIQVHGAKRGHLINQFTHQCLAALTSTFSVEENEITGIPLQCMMLAEVHAERAVRASNLDRPNLPPNLVEPVSFFEMYKKLVHKKISKVSKQPINSVWRKLREYLFKSTSARKEMYTSAHVYDAIMLLFPDWIDEFKPFLYQRDKVDENMLYSIGLVENKSRKNVPRFIHRTFAEYLLAENIINNLNTQEACVNILFGAILGRKGSSREYSYYLQDYYFNLNYSTIAYFVEMHLKQHVKNQRSSEKLAVPKSIFASQSQKFNDEDTCVAVASCCSNDLEYTFDYAAKVLHYFSIREEMRDEYFKTLPLVVAENSTNVKMVKKVIEFTQSEFGLELSYHTKENQWIVDLIVPDFTSLHVAVAKGKYNFVQHLVKIYGDDVHKLKYLLHVCVYDSAHQSESVIKDKLSIIDMLVKVNSSWITERYGTDMTSTPILQDKIHFDLFKQLVSHGADINDYSFDFGTVLHSACDASSYTERVCWIFSKGFRLIDETDCQERTPIMEAIRMFGAIDDEVLMLFDAAQADFDAVDRDGDSVLFYALRWSTSVEFIRKIAERVKNLDPRNRWGQSVAHKIIIWKRDSKFVLTILKLFKAMGYRAFNTRDRNSCTPLDLARKLELDDAVLTFLQFQANENVITPRR